MITKEQAITSMRQRGYEDVSHTQTADVVTSINFVKYLNDEIRIHANVSLKGEDVTLSFVEMKHLCELKCGRFAFDHRDFEKFEQVLMAYAAKCLDIDVFQVLALLPLKTGPAEEAKPKKKDVKERKREFWDEIVAIGKKRNYPKDGCKKFYDYWTQMNTGGVKMQFEITKAKKGVFDIGGRLATWMKNDKDWTFEKKTIVDKKVDTQNKEKEISQVINKEDVF